MKFCLAILFLSGAIVMADKRKKESYYYGCAKGEECIFDECWTACDEPDKKDCDETCDPGISIPDRKCVPVGVSSGSCYRPQR